MWAWIAILVLIGGFQLFRGAITDAAVFLALAVALVADTIGWLPAIRRRESRLPWIVVVIALVVAAAVLVLTPRHGLGDQLVLIASGLLVLIVVWPSAPSGTVSPMTARLARTAALWAAVGIALCLWELAMYLLGTFLPGGRTSFPALSDLLNPLIDSPAGRIVFVVAWLLGGVALLRRGRTR